MGRTRRYSWTQYYATEVAETLRDEWTYPKPARFVLETAVDELGHVVDEMHGHRGRFSLRSPTTAVKHDDQASILHTELGLAADNLLRGHEYDEYDEYLEQR